MTAPATRKRKAKLASILADRLAAQAPPRQALAARTFLECQVTLWSARGQLDGLARHLAEPWDTSKPKRGKYADAVRAAAVILRHPVPQAAPAGDATVLPEEREWREHDHTRPPVAEVVPTVAIIGSQTFDLPPMGEDTPDTPGPAVHEPQQDDTALDKLSEGEEP